MKKRFLFALILAFGLVGCSGEKEPEYAFSTDVEEALLEEDPLAEEEEEEIPPFTKPFEGQEYAVLFISTDGGTNFSEFPMGYTDELTPEFLISEMAFVTGWNLDLADEVTSGAGGMTVSFADTSALVVGPPEEQKDQFFCFDTYQLAESILDSVQYTLQYNFVDPALGSPEALDIYFCGEGDAELYIPQIDVTVSMYEPYSGSLME